MNETPYRRKVLAMGGMLVTSLPAEVIRKYGIKKGDTLRVIDEGDRLVVCIANPERGEVR